jgi:hypothetical protein
MCDAALAMFISKELMFNSPKTFNDPFDGQLDLKSAMEFAIQHLQYPNHTEPCKYLKNICANICIDEIVKITMDKGVFCLSSDDRNILMWSHYAAKHKGFCIGYNFSDTIFAAMLKEVNYTIDNP